MIISSLNAVIEALKAGNGVSRVWISETKRGRAIDQVKSLCREKGVVFQFVPPAVLNRKAGQAHQGICAEVAPVRLFSLDEVLADIRSGLLLVLDNIEDTGNLGAIVRTAAAADVDGIILSRHHSAPVNETVWNTSAGTLSRVRIASVGSLGDALERIKKAGFWVVGADARAETVYHEYDFRPRTALVMGGEHAGLSPLLRKRADALVSIPLAANVESLNVSVAAAVILFEALRQRKNS